MSHVPSLPAEVTIYTLSALHPQWLEWLAGSVSTTDVDASCVDQIDAAGVQWLMSLSRSLAAEGTTLRLTNPSSVVAAACETLGVASLLLQDAAGAGQ